MNKTLEIQGLGDKVFKIKKRIVSDVISIIKVDRKVF